MTKSSDCDGGSKRPPKIGFPVQNWQGLLSCFCETTEICYSIHCGDANAAEYADMTIRINIVLLTIDIILFVVINIISLNGPNIDIFGHNISNLFAPISIIFIILFPFSFGSFILSAHAYYVLKHKDGIVFGKRVKIDFSDPITKVVLWKDLEKLDLSQKT